MPVTLASCLGLTSDALGADALGACPHDYHKDGSYAFYKAGNYSMPVRLVMD